MVQVNWRRHTSAIIWIFTSGLSYGILLNKPKDFKIRCYHQLLHAGGKNNQTMGFLTMSVFLQGRWLFLNRQQIILEVFSASGEENVVLFVSKMEMNNIAQSTFPQQMLWENIFIHAALHWLIHGHDLTFMFSSLAQQTNVKSLFFLSFFFFLNITFTVQYIHNTCGPPKSKRDQ